MLKESKKLDKYLTPDMFAYLIDVTKDIVVVVGDHDISIYDDYMGGAWYQRQKAIWWICQPLDGNIVLIRAKTVSKAINKIRKLIIPYTEV